MHSQSILPVKYNKNKLNESKDNLGQTLNFQPVLGYLVSSGWNLKVPDWLMLECLTQVSVHGDFHGVA